MTTSTPLLVLIPDRPHACRYYQKLNSASRDKGLAIIPSKSLHNLPALYGTQDL